MDAHPAPLDARTPPRYMSATHAGASPLGIFSLSHARQLRRIERKLDAVLAVAQAGRHQGKTAAGLLQRLQHDEELDMADIKQDMLDLKAQVQASTDAEDAAATAFTSLAAKYDDALAQLKQDNPDVDASDLEALTASLKSHSQALAAAVVSGTPAATDGTAPATAAGGTSPTPGADGSTAAALSASIDGPTMAEKVGDGIPDAAKGADGSVTGSAGAPADQGGTGGATTTNGVPGTDVAPEQGGQEPVA